MTWDIPEQDLDHSSECLPERWGSRRRAVHQSSSSRPARYERRVHFALTAISPSLCSIVSNAAVAESGAQARLCVAAASLTHSGSWVISDVIPAPPRLIVPQTLVDRMVLLEDLVRRRRI